MLSLPAAWAVDWGYCWVEWRSGRLQESSYIPQRTRHRCKRGGNRWERRSVSRRRPAICGRTNNVESLPFPTCFSLFFTPSAVPAARSRPCSSGCVRHAVTVRREGRSYRFYRLVNDIVYDSVFLSLLRVHNEIALHILFYLVQFLPAMFRK